jgi:hypothetical protein
VLPPLAAAKAVKKRAPRKPAAPAAAEAAVPRPAARRRKGAPDSDLPT